MGLFGAAHRWGEGGGPKTPPPPPPLPKTSHSYPTMMKLGTVKPYLKKPKKDMNHVTHPLSYADINIFSLEISRFCYIRKYTYRFAFWYIISNSFNFFEFLKIFLIDMVTILMMSAKFATPGLLKIKTF